MTTSISLAQKDGFFRGPKFCVLLHDVRYIENSRSIRITTEPIETTTEFQVRTLQAIRKIANREFHHKSGKLSFDIPSVRRDEAKKYELKKGFDPHEDEFPPRRTWDEFVKEVLQKNSLTIVVSDGNSYPSYHTVAIPLIVREALRQNLQHFAKKKRKAKKVAGAK